MSNRLGIDYAGDLAGSVADGPAVLGIGARRYDVIADIERRALDVTEEGRYATYERAVTMPLSAIKALPTLQTTCALDDVTYRIDDVTRDRLTDTLILTLRRDDG